jgi:MFS family permease
MGKAERAGEWALVAMLTAAILLNYVDRGAVGIAAPLMQRELVLTATEFGVAVSAFFWVYAPVQLFLGWLCDRFDVYRLFGLGLAVWALSTMMTAFAPGLGVLILLRVLLGLGESIAFPGSSKIIASEVPDAHRGRANAMIAAAIAFGPAIGTFVGGRILDGHGWRAIFLAFGAVTLVWLLPWAWFVRHRRNAQSLAGAETYPVRRMLKRTELWLMSVAHFCSNYPFYFLLAWLPLYLVKSRGLSIGTMTSIATAAFIAQGVAALLFGWLSDRWVARGAGEDRVRRGLMAASQLIVAGAIVGAAVAPGVPSMTLCLIVAAAAGGVISANIYAVGQIFAGKRAVGSWIGVQNALGNTSGIIGPVVTGLIIDSTGSYLSAFALTAAISALGGLIWLFLIPPISAITE